MIVVKTHPNPVLAAFGFSHTLDKRFWSGVNKNGSIPKHIPSLGRCWEWRGNVDRYGSIGIGKNGTGTERCHRVSWMIHFGTIPEGKCVLHRCDNKRCVRPDHLFLGTHLENIEDMVSKGRNYKPAIRRGEQINTAKLHPESIRQIRSFRAKGMKVVPLGKLFGICHQQVLNIVNRKSWAHVS